MDSPEKFQNDPNWNEHILFYEYFHGENGSGKGASHQTGWTGILAFLIQLFGRHGVAQSIRDDGLLKGTINDLKKE